MAKEVVFLKPIGGVSSQVGAGLQTLEATKALEGLLRSKSHERPSSLWRLGSGLTLLRDSPNITTADCFNLLLGQNLACGEESVRGTIFETSVTGGKWHSFCCRVLNII